MGQQRPTAAAVVTATGLLYTGAGKINSVLITPGSDATTVTLQDGLTAAGTVLFYGEFVGGAKTELFKFVPGIAHSTGVYATITGTGPHLIVYEGS